MKKWIAVIILATVGTFVVADLAKSDDSNTDSKIGAPSTTTTEAPTTTTTVDNTAEKSAHCIKAFDQITEGLNAIADGAKLLPHVSKAAAREFLATSSEFVDTSIETVQLCADLSPVQASKTLDGLRSLKATINQVKALY